MNSKTTQTLTRAALALVFFLSYGGYATTSGFTGGQSGQGTQVGFIQRGNGAGFIVGDGLAGNLALGGQVLGGQALGGSASDGSFQGAGTGGACQGGIVTGDDGGDFKTGLRTGDSETGVIAGGETGVDDIDGGGF